MNDPIADMLTRIRNAISVNRDEVFVPFSNIKMRIAEILKAEGYIIDLEKQEGPRGEKIRLQLKYQEGRPAISVLERVSKPGRRVYAKRVDIQRVLEGMGISVVSTSKGVMSDKDARKQKLGGEIICKIW